MTDAQPAMHKIIEAMVEDEYVTPAVATQLTEKIGEHTIGQIIGMTKFELRNTLSGIPLPLEIAGKVFDYLEAAGLMPAIASPPAALTEALKVKLELPRNISDMSLKELLDYAVNNPDRYDEVLAFIQAQPQVQRATAKTESWAIVSDGQLDVDATVRYVTHLARDYTQVSEMFEGVRPTSLANALGNEVRPYIHPFTHSPVVGNDDLGFDFSTLDEQLHNALLFGLLTKHPAWPATVDRYTMSTELFQNPLPGRWQLILSSYLAARADGGHQHHDAAMRITRYWPKDMLRGKSGGVAPFVPAGHEPERNEAWYEKELRDYMQAAVRQGNSTIRKGPIIVHSLFTGNGNIHLDDTIVLGNVRTGNGSLNGRAWLALECSASTGSGRNSLEVYNRTWKQLYEKAIELGIIRD